MSTRSRQSNAFGAGANSSRRPQTTFSADKGGATVKGTGISFTNPGTIADSNNGLAAIPVGAVISVAGSPANSRTFRVGASSAGSLTVTPGVVTTEIAGAAITISIDE